MILLGQFKHFFLENVDRETFNDYFEGKVWEPFWAEMSQVNGDLTAGNTTQHRNSSRAALRLQA